MENNIAIEDKGFFDINPVQCGHEKCAPKHSFGPAIRSFYLIHYCVSGSGVLEKAGKIYNISSGQAFLICPDEVTLYRADENEPWEYIWIGFNGRLAAMLDDLPSPVFTAPYSLFKEMLEAKNLLGMREEYLAGKIFLMIANLFEKKQNDNYVEMAENFIVSNYNRDIKIREVAAAIGVDQRYLSRLFKQKKGITMQEALISCRMNTASVLLSQGYRVGETSLMVGYRDQFVFSKMYKKFYGYPPSHSLESTTC